MVDDTKVLFAWQRQTAASYGFAARAGRRMKIGLSEVAILEQLQVKGPLAPGAIGEALAMPSGSVTALIDRLEAKRFVERKNNPTDRRGFLVALSSGAMERAAVDLLPMADLLLASAASRSSEERETIANFLDEIAKILETGARKKDRSKTAQVQSWVPENEA